MKIAKPTPTADLDEQALGNMAVELGKLQDYITASLGPEAYVSVSVSWEGSDGKLTTLSVTHVDPTDDDEDETRIEVEE